MTLKRRGWYAEDDPEMLIFYQIFDDSGTEVWMSGWYDIRDVDEGKIIEKQVKEVCAKYNIQDLSELL